jgi:hypothetical protein
MYKHSKPIIKKANKLVLLAVLANNPQTSSQQTSHRSGTSCMDVIQILHDKGQK